MPIKSVMPSNHFILCHPLLLLPSIFPSIRIFSNKSALCSRWPKYWSFNMSPSNEYSGLISFWIDWFALLAVQRPLRSLPQHHNSKASILRHSALFMAQLSHPYMTTGKTIALNIQTFVGKVTSLLFNMLASFVITFLPRSKDLLISWLQSPSEGVLEPKKLQSVTVSTFFPSICHEMIGLDAVILDFFNAVSSQLFHSSLPPSSRGSLVPPHFLPLTRDHLHTWVRLVTHTCLTLCSPMDCGLPGSSVHEDSPGKNAGVGCHALLHIWSCWYFSWQSWLIQPGDVLCIEVK